MMAQAVPKTLQEPGKVSFLLPSPAYTPLPYVMDSAASNAWERKPREGAMSEEILPDIPMTTSSPQAPLFPSVR